MLDQVHIEKICRLQYTCDPAQEHVTLFAGAGGGEWGGGGKGPRVESFVGKGENQLSAIAKNVSKSKIFLSCYTRDSWNDLTP